MIIIQQVPAEVVWPIRHRVMYPDDDFESIKLSDDATATHLALYNDGTLVSVVSLFLKNDDLQFRKFATVTEYQGKGFGSALLNHIIEFGTKYNVNRIWCNARKTASPFYQKFGFRETDKTFYQHGLEFVVMELLQP